jgi:hypothetical protein
MNDSVFPTSATSTLLKTVGGVNVYQRGDLVYWTGGLAVDADGSPRAYNPNSALGLDNLGNAGSRGNWWALVVNRYGIPVMQGPSDPAPGFYISTTALTDSSKAWNDPARFVNAETVPYIVVPRSFIGFLGKGGVCRLGDLALVVNLDNGSKIPCIIADIGPNDELGEGSIALATALDIPCSPRSGGCEDGLLTIVFPNSGATPAWPRSQAEINAAVAGLVTAHHLNLPNITGA